MKVRVRFQPGPRIARTAGKNRHVASAVAALLWPGVLMAFSLGFWALGSQLSLSGDFAISRGIFSHWQVWIAVGILLTLSALVLGRYGRTGDLRIRGSFIARLSGFGSRRA